MDRMHTKWLLIGLGSCLAAAAGAVGWRRYCSRRQKTAPTPEQDIRIPMQTPEEKFLHQWTELLSRHADVFNGLYAGLSKVRQGTSKRPEKLMREWFQRAHYQWEDSPSDRFFQETIRPLIEAEDRDGLVKWGCLLYQAAEAAGITRDQAEMLVLNAENVNAYVEWDGNELCLEDSVEIILPAWYQHGKTVEQGQCKLRPEEE